MFRFEEPLYLYLLLLIPLLAGLHYATNYYRRKRLLRYGDIELLKGLMPDVSATRREVKTWLMLAAFGIVDIHFGPSAVQGQKMIPVSVRE